MSAPNPQSSTAALQTDLVTTCSSVKENTCSTAAAMTIPEYSLTPSKDFKAKSLAFEEVFRNEWIKYEGDRDEFDKRLAEGDTDTASALLDKIRGSQQHIQGSLDKVPEHESLGRFHAEQKDNLDRMNEIISDMARYVEESKKAALADAAELECELKGEGRTEGDL